MPESKLCRKQIALRVTVYGKKLMNFARLTLTDWQQFADVDIKFHPRATIITGSNGSGKTTILSILASHVGWHHMSLATPKADLASNSIKYVSLDRRLENKDQVADMDVGSLTYTDGSIATLQAPEVGCPPEYMLQVINSQWVPFVYMPSHRQTFSYKRVQNIGTFCKERKSAFYEVFNNMMQRQKGDMPEPNSLIMKNTLLGWMIHGYGVSSPTKTIMPADPQQIKNFEGFRDVLRLILPQSLGFEDIEIRDYEIVFCCNGGSDEFLLETASGGIAVLIEIAWQVYMFDTEAKEPFVVVIDEVENHLHPSLQRTLLPSLINAFPHAKFIVSTHSPLVVTSVEDSYVYALKYDDNKKIKSYLLDFKTEVKNAVDVLDEVLGVSTTMPAWAVGKLAAILEKYTNSDPTAESLASLRLELESVGLGRLFPKAIGEIAEARK